MALKTHAFETSDQEPMQYRLVAPSRVDEFVLPGIRFGRPDQLLSPAYWAMRCETANPDDIDFVNRHGSLEEEVGFCLLGGFGVTLEVATAFYERLRDEGIFHAGKDVSESFLLKLLTTPAIVNGRPHKYRFPNQRAHRIRLAMLDLERLTLPIDDPVEFRDQIQSIKGVGPKTASWITRNWLDTDDVAILDIHVLRAGWWLGLFDQSCRLPRDYTRLENRFLMFAKNLHVRPSCLDSVMWLDMRTFGSNLARGALLD